MALFRNGDALRNAQSSTSEQLDFATFFNLSDASFGARRDSSVWSLFLDGHIMLAGIGRLKTGVNVLTSADQTIMIDWAKREGVIS
jgi:hypothetical protein